MKKRIKLKYVLIIEAILLLLGGIFIFQVEDSTAESLKKEETLQEIEIIARITDEYGSRSNELQTDFMTCMQAKINALVYAYDHVPDFEITRLVEDSFSEGPIVINPAEDSSRKYITSTASDGTVFALDMTDYDDSWMIYDPMEIPDVIFPALFEENDLFMVLDANDIILNYPTNPELVGKPISELGIKPSQITSKKGVWLNIDDQDYYTVSSWHEGMQCTFVAAINSRSFNINNHLASALIILSISIVITLLVIYIYFSKQEENLKKEMGVDNESDKGQNKGILAVIVIIAIALMTFHIQSLFSLSMFTMVEDTESTILEWQVDYNESGFFTDTMSYNELNNILADNIAAIFSSYPELQTNEHINKLMNIYSVSYIKLFDANMNEIATSPISEQNYQNYANQFKTYLPSYSILSAQSTENLESTITLTKTVGIANSERTGANTVAIGFDRDDYIYLTLDLDLQRILTRLSEPGNIEIIAVDQKTKNIVFASIGNYTQFPASRLGIDENYFQDNRYDTMTIDGVRYCSITTTVNGYTVFLMEPSSVVFEGRVSIVAAVTIFCSICITLLLLLINKYEVSPLPKPDTQENRNQTLRLLDNFNRINGVNNWWNKTPEEKTYYIAKIIMYILIVIFLLIFLFRNSLQTNKTLFGFIVSGKWRRGVNLYAVTAATILCLTYSFIMNILRFIFKKLLSVVNSKSKTFLSLLQSFIIYVSIVALVFYCMYLFGMDSKAILASAGIIGFIISWGSQDLITDILAGLFIIFENQFQVGDIIELNGQRGTVQQIGIRTTQIILISGDILNVSNRNLSKISNKTRKLSNTGIMLFINYDQNIPKIEAMLREELPKLKDIHPGIISGPGYAGFLDFTDQYARLIVSFTSTEKDKFMATCKVNTEICRLFNEHGFEMGIDPIEIKL